MNLVTTIKMKLTLNNLELGRSRLVGERYTPWSLLEVPVPSSLLFDHLLWCCSHLQGSRGLAHFAIPVPILEIQRETSGDLLPLRMGHGSCTQLSLPSHPIDKNFVTVLRFSSMWDWVYFFFWLAMCSSMNS